MNKEVALPDNLSLTVVAVPAATSESRPEAATPAVKKPSFGYLVTALAGGNAASSALRILGGYLQARCVLPHVLGLFGRIGLVQEYIRFAQVGIFNGLNRELPYFYGKGDHRRVADLASAALAWSLCLGTSISITVAGIAVWWRASR